MRRLVISIYDDRHNPHYGGGGAVVVQEVATRLAGRWDVTVLAGSFPGCRPRDAGRLHIRYLPVGWAGRRGGQLLFQLLAPLVALTTRFDVWIENLNPPASVSLLPLTAPGRVIGLAQMLSGEDMQKRYRLPFKRLERRGLRWYRNLIVLNSADQATVAENAPAARVWLVPNAVEVPDRSLTSPGDGDFILFLGRIDVRQKGIDLLLDAHRLACTNLPLVIAGTGPPAEVGRLRRLVQGRDDVHMLGRVSGPHKDKLLRDCALLAMPSRFETFGLCALEAMSYGKPVVHFDLPQLSWIPEGCGLRVSPFRVDELAQALRRLSLDKSLRERVGVAARAVAEGHDWDTLTRRYEDIIDEVAGLRG